MKLLFIFLSTFLIGDYALASTPRKNCGLTKVIRPLPKHALTPEEQTQWEPELRDLFLNHHFATVKRNPRQESKPSFIVSFHGTTIRAVLKKVALNDIIEVEGVKVNAGLRGAIATESDYLVSKRMGFHSFPFVVRRYISETDPLIKQNPELQSGMYVVSYFIENATTFADDPFYLTLKGNPDPVFGDDRNRVPEIVKIELYGAIVGESDGLGAVFDSVTKRWIGVDGVCSFTRSWTDLPHLMRMTRPNEHHYLNDSKFFDHLATLDANAVFAGLEEMSGLRGYMTLNYAQAKMRLVAVQQFVHETRAKLGLPPL